MHEQPRANLGPAPTQGLPSPAIDELVEAIQALSLARDLPTVMEIVRHAARKLANADGATFVLRDNDHCHYADEDAISPLWKGQRFPMSACISGWVMNNRQSVVIDDILLDPRIPTEVYLPTFVRSMAMVPIRARQPIGAIGNYWAESHCPTLEDLRLLQALADATAVTLENIQIFAELEERIRPRVTELENMNEKLRQEIAERERVEAEVRQLALTDELSGLYNRRGFLLLAEQQLRMARRSNLSCWLLFADLDGLKSVNDNLGHETGDKYIANTAQALRESFRDADVVGRLGGDEFAILVISAHEALQEIRHRLNRNIDRVNRTHKDQPPLSLSLGAVRYDPQTENTIEHLLDQADTAMYEEKRAKAIGASA